MKIKFLFTFSMSATLMLAGCGGAPSNKPAGNANASNAAAGNTNSAAKPAVPTKDELVAIEKKAWQDWAARKGEELEGYMASKFLNVGSNGATVRDDAMKSWTTHKCEMKDLAFSNEKVTPFGEGVAMLTFQAKWDMKCDGKAGPDTLNVSVLYANEGGKWKAMYYQETPAADAKGEYAPPSTPVDKEKELASLSAPDDEIVAAETKLWDSWKAQDRKGFEEYISAKFFANGRSGFMDREAYLKGAFDPPCKVESVSTGPMKAMEINKDLTMIIYRASQKGTCGTDKLPENVLSVSIYGKENGKPMAMYYMENPVK